MLGSNLPIGRHYCVLICLASCCLAGRASADCWLCTETGCIRFECPPLGQPILPPLYSTWGACVVNCPVRGPSDSTDISEIHVPQDNACAAGGQADLGSSVDNGDNARSDQGYLFVGTASALLLLLPFAFLVAQRHRQRTH